MAPRNCGPAKCYGPPTCAAWSAGQRRPPQAELDQLKKQALEVLGIGIDRMAKTDTVDAALASAAFAMAQISIESSQPDKAIEWLEHPKYGPLTLLKAGNPAATREGFANETYKMALRAYIAVTPQQLKKAEAVMDALEKQVQRSPTRPAAENLTAIYVSLGRELQQHLQELRKTGKNKEADSVSKAFEVFLDRVAKRKAGNSYATLNWVGETYYGLGGGLDDNGPVSPKAKAYYQKATTAYQKMLEVAEEDPKFQEQPEKLYSVRLRLADCERRSGEFDAAIKTILTVVREKAHAVDRPSAGGRNLPGTGSR